MKNATGTDPSALFSTDSREPDGAGGQDASRAALRPASGHALHDVRCIMIDSKRRRKMGRTKIISVKNTTI
jgi:hypothetical protein